MSRTSSHNQSLVDNFFKQIQDTDIKVFQFSMDPESVRALFDYDPCEFEDTCMVTTLSEYIDIFNTVSEDKKVQFLCSENSNWYRSNDEDLYTCYQLFKILWLCQDIKKNGQQAPIQFIKTNESYLCHPGSDKRYAISLLEPIDTIQCFYIYYPEIDYDLDIPAKLNQISDPDEFISLFSQANQQTFHIEGGDVSLKSDGSYKSCDHFEPFAREACGSKMCMDKTEWEIQVPHLSYRDRIHREKMLSDLEIFSQIVQVEDDEFHLGEYKFFKIDGIWTPERFANKHPESLIDKNFTFDSYNFQRMKK